MTKTSVEDLAAGCVNEVRVVGRVSAVPETRTLPSGDEVVCFRVVVRRARPRGRAVVDTLECAVWTSALRRTVARWQAGDAVEVAGALRRRFFRAGGASASRVEIEVSKARRLARSDVGAPAP